MSEIWQSVVKSLAAAIEAAGVAGQECLAIGITNQRETTVVWDRATGEPIHRAIVWQDRRTADTCASLKADGLEDVFRERTGLPVETLNPLTRMVPSSRFDQEYLDDVAPALGVGVGLALREVDV